MSPKVYCSTSSQREAQHREYRKYQRGEETQLHLNHDGHAQTELESSGLQWRAGGRNSVPLCFCSPWELIIGLPLTLVEAGLSHSHLSVQVSLRRVCWMICTSICVLE